MLSSIRPVLGLALAAIGFLGSIIICALPEWKFTVFIGANIITSSIIWEGLWMSCVMQSTGQTQCKNYDPLLLPSKDLQVARVLVIIAIILGVFGILLSVAGGKCTNFIKDQRRKCEVTIAAGIIFIIAGLMVLIPVCWSANTIIQDSYNPILINAHGRELGLALYIGWGAAGLLVLGGGLLCSSYQPGDENNHSVRYRADP